MPLRSNSAQIKSLLEVNCVTMQQHSVGGLSSLCVALLLCQGFAVCIVCYKETFLQNFEYQYKEDQEGFDQLKDAGEAGGCFTEQCF